MRMTPEQRFARLAETLGASGGVTEVSDAKPGPKRFGKSHELRVQNRIFAMLVRSSLVVKLPLVGAALVLAWRGRRRWELAATALVIATAGVLVSLPPPR